MEDIKICIFGFFTESTPDPATVAHKCQSLGFDALYVGDHPVMPAESQGLVGTGQTASHSRLEGGNQYPEFYSHMPDPFLLLMAAATATTRLKIGTGVTLVPEREPRQYLG